MKQVTSIICDKLCILARITQGCERVKATYLSRLGALGFWAITVLTETYLGIL